MNKYLLFFKKRFDSKAQRLSWLALAILLLGAFLELSWEFWEKDHTLFKIDREILYFFEGLRHHSLNAAAVDITALGSFTSCLIISLVVVTVLWMGKDKIGLYFYSLVIIGAGFWTFLIKHLVGRVRPTEVAPLIVVFGHSYPSGHTLVGTSIYLSLAFFGCRFFPTLKSKIVLFFLAIFISGLVGLSRIYLGAHYPSDVLGGVFLGSGWVTLLRVLFYSNEKMAQDVS